MEMLKNLFRANFVTTGLAMFAMFFGSGNLIFPVAIGAFSGAQNGWAISGLFVTAVFLPFATLCLMLLYNGDYHHFFQKVGVVPGKIITFATLALIGPFGVLPRCIAFSHSTLSLYFPSVGLFEYAIVACLLVFLLSIKKSDVVGLIGNFLTPLLLVSLVIVISKGLAAPHEAVLHKSQLTELGMLKYGFIEGYKTFDIFAALFFASAIIPAFRTALGGELTQKRSFMKLVVQSSLVGIALLFAVYAGLSFVAANLQQGLVGVPADQLLGTITSLTMGKTAGLMANVVVTLACLTTAITLAVVSAEFFRKEIFFHRVSYINCLVLTMVIALLFSWLGFAGIMQIVIPILLVLCPAVIVLVIVNALNYFFGFKYIRTPFYITLVISFFLVILS